MFAQNSPIGEFGSPDHHTSNGFNWLTVTPSYTSRSEISVPNSTLIINKIDFKTTQNKFILVVVAQITIRFTAVLIRIQHAIQTHSAPTLHDM